MPNLWSETVEAHRREVRDAILDTTVSLVAEQGLLSVTMSLIAERTGIGRATLYKYFPNVEAILLAWHERQFTAHLALLGEVRDGARSPGQRLGAVIEAYAGMLHATRSNHDPELAALLHQDRHMRHAQEGLQEMMRVLIAEAATAGTVRSDVVPEELAHYCLHALRAAGSLPSKEAVHRLVTLVLAGLNAETGHRLQATPSENEG